MDDFADQVYSIENILKICDKVDLLFFAAERSYRHRFITEVLAGTPVRSRKTSSLSAREAGKLIETYVEAGLVGSETFIKDRSAAIGLLERDPIAVACCRILNDLKPLDRIVDSLLADSNKYQRTRYLIAALAQFCTNSGLRSDLLIAATSGAGLSAQFNASHPLPLTYSEEISRNYVVPLNGTIAKRVLELIAQRYPGEIFDAFVSLAKTIAPRVNRRTIVQRTPEARLAARLFDLDQVVEGFLGDRKEEFYEVVEDDWRWNSRYWEQIALLNLYKSQSLEAGSSEARDALELAIGHARHAVSIERHPLTLTTLAKILLSAAPVDTSSASGLLVEALASLSDAIAIEKRRGRTSVHPYVVMFQGLKTLPVSAVLKDTDVADIKLHLKDAARKFARDPEVVTLISETALKLR